VSNNFIGIDGFQRNRADDARMSVNMASLFRTELGQEVFKYLKSITIDAVNGPNVTDAELRHLEGQRYLVGLIDRRIQHADTIKLRGVKNERAS
tara:strand:+ start:5620 stop:5901 length:282 start_codon:yes stop_codon:yes gene_type:complete